MRQQFRSFVIRWILNTLGLWLAVKLFGTGYTERPEGLVVFLIAGLIFSIVNAVLRPIMIILALPALLITLGLFMFVVNGFLVYISLKMAPGVSMAFWNSVLTGIVISLVNYIISNIIDLRYTEVPKGDDKL
jgi:putative membrane protein